MFTKPNYRNWSSKELYEQLRRGDESCDDYKGKLAALKKKSDRKRYLKKLFPSNYDYWSSVELRNDLKLGENKCKDYKGKKNALNRLAKNDGAAKRYWNELFPPKKSEPKPTPTPVPSPESPMLSSERPPSSYKTWDEFGNNHNPIRFRKNREKEFFRDLQMLKKGKRYSKVCKDAYENSWKKNEAHIKENWPNFKK